MSSLIREAFKKVKEDITNLSERINRNKDEVEKIGEGILAIKKDYKKNLDNVHEKLEEILDFQKKEISNLKRQITLLRKEEIKSVVKKRVYEEPLYEAEEEVSDKKPSFETEDGEKEKKKGWFNKMVDFLAEEDD